MPFGFLSQLPGLIGKGIGAVGGGVKKVPGLFGRLGQQDVDDIMLTPGINPSAGMPQIRRPRSLAQDSPRTVFAEPEAQGPPRMDQPSPLQPRTAMDRPSPLALPLPIPGGDPSGRSFPAPTEASPITDPLLAAKAEHNARYKKPQGFGQRLKGALLPALKGGFQGLQKTGDIGGFIGGAAGRGILAGAKPFAEHQLEFEQEQKPRILEEQGRQREQALFDEARRKAGLEERYRTAQIAQEQAQTAGMASPEEARAERETERKYKEAQTQAALRGTPQKTQLDDGSGQVWEVLVYPDDRQEWLGQSGAAEIKGQDRESREKIAANRDAAAMARTQATQGAISARQKVGGGSGGKEFISMSKIRAATAKYNKDHPSAKITVQDMIAAQKQKNPKTEIVKDK